MNTPLFVGTDVHRKKNMFALMNSQGREVVPRFSAENNRPGTEQSIKQLVELLKGGEYDGIKLAAEATSWYWFHFFQMLSQDPTLAQWPLELYMLNPRLTANYKRVFSDLDKTDRIDAFVTADRLRMGRDLPPPYQYDERYLPLRMLTPGTLWVRYHIVHNLAREKAYCLSMLYLKASEYTRQGQEPFADVFGAASQAVIQEFPSIEAMAALPFAELVEFIDVKGKRRFADPSENARKLQKVAQDSYPLPQALQAPVNLVLKLSLAEIAHLEHQEKRLNTAIAEQMAAIPQTLETIPGFGPVFAAGILAEIGDIARFEFDEAKVAKFAGFKWRKTESADFSAAETRLTRMGNAYLRYYFCEAANIVRMHDADYAAFYDRKFHEVRKHQHKRAIVLTARKLVRLVVRLLTTNQPYRPRRPIA